jgi:hypothetical protein
MNYYYNIITLLVIGFLMYVQYYKDVYYVILRSKYNQCVYCWIGRVICWYIVPFEYNIYKTFAILHLISVRFVL